MKTFRYTEADETIRIFNPMFITDVKLTTSEYADAWCIVISFKDKQTPYTITFTSKDQAIDCLEEINKCLESI
jgi:hypothetical protein